LEYALLTKGKRLRPILVILSAQSVGGNPEKVMRLALAFELLHTATLVHDDIIDQDITRRGIKTLYSQWSTNGAILTGDALIALAINLAADYGPQIMKILSNVGLELCEGEYVDATLSLTRATEQEYFTKIEKKSASLFRGAACCGALAVEGNLSEIEALAKFGEYFGMAYQVNDDLEDLLNRNQISQDLKNGNVTLPLLFLYQHGDKTSRKLLIENFGNRSITRVTTEKLRAELDKFGAFSYCRSKVAEYSKQAHSSLEEVRNSVFKDYLAQFFDHVNKFEG
jgi:octaprenyl-diphosphate synthase